MVSVGSALNKYMMFTFGDWIPHFARNAFGKSAHTTGHVGLVRYGEKNASSIFANLKTSYQRAEKASIYKAGIKDASNFSYVDYMKGSAKSWGSEISAGVKNGTGVVSKTVGASKGLFSGAMKRMPLVGTVLALGMEIPNVFRAFTDKDGGAVTGTVETGKAAVKLGAFAGGAAAGAAIGTLIFPVGGTIAGGIIGFVGSAIGGMALMTVSEKIVGKSFTEKKEAAAAVVAQEQQLQEQGAPVASGVVPQGQVSALPTALSDQEIAKMAGITPEMVVQYRQIAGASANQLSTNPFGQADFMNRNLIA